LSYGYILKDQWEIWNTRLGLINGPRREGLLIHYRYLSITKILQSLAITIKGSYLIKQYSKNMGNSIKYCEQFGVTC
jgi:hypothetical protein